MNERLDPKIRSNWEKIDKLLPILQKKYDEEVFGKLISLYEDIGSRTLSIWERERIEEQIKWLQQLKKKAENHPEEHNRSSLNQEILQNQKQSIGNETNKPDSIAPNLTYDDIGGLKNEINAIREVVELPLRHPEIFKRLGISPPKGVLLKGPSGCGKTILAQAVANESKAHFFLVNGPEVMSKFYGESERSLRDKFCEAEKNSPSIIFIDEIDAIAPKRAQVDGEVEKRLVAQLLVLMDGLKKRGQVIVIAATNIPDALDPALRRPGRFDREIEIGLPDYEGRLEILHIHAARMPLSRDVDLKTIATKTDGFSGAQLEAICREAAYTTIRRHEPDLSNGYGVISSEKLNNLEVSMEDFMIAIDKVSEGEMTAPNNGLRVSWDEFLERQKKEQTQNVN